MSCVQLTDIAFQLALALAFQLALALEFIQPHNIQPRYVQRAQDLDCTEIMKHCTG